MVIGPNRAGDAKSRHVSRFRHFYRRDRSLTLSSGFSVGLAAGISKAQATIDCIDTRNIGAAVDVVQIAPVSQGWAFAKEVRSRFVVDMATLRAGERTA